jgi:hypothetical protein
MAITELGMTVDNYNSKLESAHNYHALYYEYDFPM